MRTIPAFVAAAVLAVAVSPAAAQSADISGTWTASFSTPDRAYPARIELKQDKETLSGQVLPAGGEPNKLTGSVKAGEITFTFSTPDPSGNGRILAVAVTATASSDGLTGSFNVDDAPTGTFSAKREAAKDAKDPKASAGPAASGATADVGGTWAFTVDLGSITASPTVVFKQDGGALTGTYTSQQYGQFPLKGTVKGNEVQFAFTMTIEGNALDVQFSGAKDADGLKGTVSYGGLGEGSFVAKKTK